MSYEQVSYMGLGGCLFPICSHIYNPHLGTSESTCCQEESQQVLWQILCPGSLWLLQLEILSSQESTQDDLTVSSPRIHLPRLLHVFKQGFQPLVSPSNSPHPPLADSTSLSQHSETVYRDKQSRGCSLTQQPDPASEAHRCPPLRSS